MQRLIGLSDAAQARAGCYLTAAAVLMLLAVTLRRPPPRDPDPSMSNKACPTHGPIDWPLTATTCPACGLELEAYDSQVEMALAMPQRGSGSGGCPRPEISPAELVVNARQMLVVQAAADAEAADRRMRAMGLRPGR